VKADRQAGEITPYKRLRTRQSKNWNSASAQTLLSSGSGLKAKESSMPTQIVMDHTGDTRHYFDANDAQTLAKAEERFKELARDGFTAAVRTAAGDICRIPSFDPTAEETLFFPRLVGG